MKKQVVIDSSVKDLNIPIINWNNEIKTLSAGETYNTKSTVIRICVLEDTIICDPNNESIEISFIKGSIEYLSIDKFKIKSGKINVVNI